MLFEEQANIVVVALTLLIIIVVLYKLEMTLLISHVVLFLCLWAYCTSFSFRFQSRMQTRLIERPRLLMASSRPGSGGATKLDKKISTATKPTYREEIEKDWRLILHDDNVHTIQQVCEILSKTCPLCSGSRAYEVTLQVHMTGAATVAVANKKIINEYSKSLQMAGLTVSAAPDDEFEPESSD